MTTKKQPAVSKHKHTTTRRIVQPAPQAFDIIPRSQVRPSTTSRPVIPSNTPEVADTTLTTPPTVKLSHQTLISGQPGNDDILLTDEPAEAVAGAPEPTLSPPVLAATKPLEVGVSVADLIAKKSEPVVVAAPIADDGPKLPLVEPPATETEPEPELATDKPVENTSGPAPGSLAHALSEDSDKPQEHSDALKDAIKDLDSKDAPAHHELYGGKPVIVVHKPHGKQSAAMWMLWFFVCIGLALLIVNFLLDAEIIETMYNVPHSDIL